MTAVPTFNAGQLLGDRFKVVRFIGRGGMGEVYEAEDLELREHVALKTIRPEIVDDAGTIERFKREIQLARLVTHPNVCRIFDLFHHGAFLADGQAPAARDVTFVTMELLAGETLEQRLRRTGRVKTAEALPLVDQMADALAAAHRAGIVHRDFKSGNVILAAPAPGTIGTRVVVTDFGLARRKRRQRSGRGNDDGHLRHRGHAGVHGAGTSRRTRDDAGGRHLRAGRRAVRDGDGPASLFGRHATVGRRQTADRDASDAAASRA